MNRRKPDSSNCRTHSTLSVSSVDYYLNIPTSNPPSPAISTVTLTPGRIRNIDQDMEALRASRQDNPFIKQIIASRESLIDSLEEESDHANLMSQELFLDLDIDPLSLPEMHEHMIRSPPPTIWSKSPANYMFQFPNNDMETLQVDVNNTKESLKSDTSPLRKSHLLQQDMLSLITPHSLRTSTGEDSIHLIDN